MLNMDPMQGDAIEPDITTKSQKYYSIELEEIHWLKESGECMYYGVEEQFDSFADCVANEYEKIFKPTLGCTIPWHSAPGCTIPWHSAPKNEKICNTKLNSNGSTMVQRKIL